MRSMKKTVTTEQSKCINRCNMLNKLCAAVDVRR